VKGKMAQGKASFLRFVLPRERMHDLVDEAKGLTWEHNLEHALLQIEDGRRVMVRGSTYEIELGRGMHNDPFGRNEDELYVEIEGQPRRVIRLVFHTHPKPTGPSDDDLEVLRLLKQGRSMLYELFGPRDGTEIRLKDG
jgi:hypothetical protein